MLGRRRHLATFETLLVLRLWNWVHSFFVGWATREQRQTSYLSGSGLCAGLCTQDDHFVSLAEWWLSGWMTETVQSLADGHVSNQSDSNTWWIGEQGRLIHRIHHRLGKESQYQLLIPATSFVYYIMLSQYQQRWADLKLTAQQMALENVLSIYPALPLDLWPRTAGLFWISLQHKSQIDIQGSSSKI